MRPSRKDISKLSSVNSRWLSGDPKAIRDNCVACGQWVEDLNPKTRRCGEEECERELAQRALSLGRAVKIKNTIVVMGELDAVVGYSPPNKPTSVRIIPHKARDLCLCGKEVKRPGDDRCVRCRLKANAKKYKKGKK
jgi:hypothetical protein